MNKAIKNIWKNIPIGLVTTIVRIIGQLSAVALGFLSFLNKRNVGERQGG